MPTRDAGPIRGGGILHHRAAAVGAFEPSGCGDVGRGGGPGALVGRSIARSGSAPRWRCSSRALSTRNSGRKGSGRVVRRYAAPGSFVAGETPSNLVAVIAISAAVFLVGDQMARIESEMCSLQGFCGPAALRHSGGVAQLPITTPILSRLASMQPGVARLRCQAVDPVGRLNVSGRRPRVPIGVTTFSRSVTAHSRLVCHVG